MVMVGLFGHEFIMYTYSIFILCQQKVMYVKQSKFSQNIALDLSKTEPVDELPNQIYCQYIKLPIEDW